jgi:ferrous iron transport protein B
MYDEVEKRGDIVNADKLGELFGIPMVPTSFHSGMGVEELFHEVIKTYEMQEGVDPHYRHIHINHGHEIENGIADIQEHLKAEDNL